MSTKFSTCDQHKNLALSHPSKDLLSDCQFCNSCGYFYKLPTPAKPFGDGEKSKLKLVKISKAEHAALVAVAEAAEDVSLAVAEGCSSEAEYLIGLNLKLIAALANLAAIRNGGGK